MPIKPEEVPPLIRRFEPVLHLHKDERFFPSDAKRYMEKSALWTVEGSPRTLKFNWGGSGPFGFPRQPRIARGSIAAESGEPGTFVGMPIDGGVEELFLDLSGWRDGTAVTNTSENQHADLDGIAESYGATFAPGTDATLARSRFWYHAEIFNHVRLREVTADDDQLWAAVKDLGDDPAVLCYYFFFPGSDGHLQGCGSSGQAFESHAGQWTCVAILLNGSTPIGGATQYSPEVVCLSSRSPGSVDISSDGRIFGMEAFGWDLVDKVGPPGGPNEHPVIFVASGTHGLYRQPGAQPVQQPALNDLARLHCGRFETLQAANAAAAAVDAHTAEQDPDNEILLAKVLVGAGLFGPIGFVVGGILALAEAGAFPGFFDLEPATVVQPATPQIDQAPSAGDAGIIIHPVGVDLPDDAGSARKILWPATDNDLTLSSVIDGRTYSLMVSAGGNPFARPPWLRSASNIGGFKGRWGNRVTEDPFNRRAGMAFPEYSTLSLRAYARLKSR